MDTSETYIKMCEKAEEIQALFPWHDDIASQPLLRHQIFCGDDEPAKNILLDEGDNLWFEGGFIDELPRLPKATIHIWLPRQDQLQEVSGLDWHDFDRKCLVYENVPTKEQAGIRVVMKERYSKIWNGEDWIKS